ncbi:phage shock protein C (PspC) family protein [Pseudonocardia sediminis]|uniref:Phage shock protein C (PspC) family protein n=2 Tax=Pseudonocardia sediminis TaxID=1397368 RepID=A0A4Q7V490_PSEST|nr:phage shock protein C (PspC) family protein [Pseudonocardia sediminis]
MWRTRPSRPRDDRKVAGVASAIGRRYDVDPVLVRIAFVVAAFYGPGIPLYLAGCAALPDAGSPHRPGRGQAAALTVTVLVASAAVVSALLFLGADGGWFLPMLASLGLLVALHVTRGRRGPAGRAVDGGPAGPDTPATAHHTGPTALVDPAGGHDRPAPAGPPGTGGDATAPVASDTAADGDGAAPARADAVAPPPAPPSWDPLGAAPFAWDLPEPGPEPAPPLPPRSRLTPITLGIALVASGIVAVLALTAPGLFGVAAVPATALAVVGVGLVVGAFRHVGRWLIPFALVLAAATWLAAAVPWADLDDGVGDLTAAPQTAAQVATEYRRGAGDITLDLRGLDLTATPGVPVTPVRTSAQLGVGTVTVLVPPGADLVARGDVGVGDISLDGRAVDGAPVSTTVNDPGSDGPGGRPIELDLHAEVGSVVVTRG